MNIENSVYAIGLEHFSKLRNYKGTELITILAAIGAAFSAEAICTSSEAKQVFSWIDREWAAVKGLEESPPVLQGTIRPNVRELGYRYQRAYERNSLNEKNGVDGRNKILAKTLKITARGMKKITFLRLSRFVRQTDSFAKTRS